MTATITTPNNEQRADLLRRAKIAYLQTGGAETPNDRSGYKMLRGLGYVVLHGARGVLAVYRVRTDNGLLRRLKRWPVWVGK